ncbi:MAG: VOC family protein [Pedobacter sp.]|nr:VOC family protein [Pedobacter sp.]
MSYQAQAGAVIFSKDINVLARFYENLLVLTRTHAEPDHIVLESAHLQLVIHGIPTHIARSIHISSPPARREDTPIKLFFPVESLAAARKAAALLGGELNAAAKEWEARGFRACDGHDPEGNVFQLRQSIS